MLDNALANDRLTGNKQDNTKNNQHIQETELRTPAYDTTFSASFCAIFNNGRCYRVNGMHQRIKPTLEEAK